MKPVYYYVINIVMMFRLGKRQEKTGQELKLAYLPNY